jgi:hypothetical protein
MQGLFHMRKDLTLIGEPLRQAFSVQFEVPVDEDRLIGRHDGGDLLRGHAQIEEGPDHRCERIPSRLRRPWHGRRLAVRIRT